MKPVTVDFETLPIEGRPHYPPVPVGVSIKYPGKKAKYLAWGHLSKNNCTWGEAQQELAQAWKHKDGLLFQNGKFDVDVAEVHFSLPIPEWQRIHDTMFLLFLDDPHQIDLGLKPASTRLLGMPADEQDAVAEWLIKYQPINNAKISKSQSSEHYFGAYIAFAPGDVVGRYANGDVLRTERLFNLLYKKNNARGMQEAYDRERELMPILLEIERQGVPVDLNRLRADVKHYTDWLAVIEAWIVKKIKAPSDINLNSGAQLVETMIEAGVCDPELLPLTPTGKYSTKKESLLLGVTDKQLLAVLKYRTQLNTCLRTFMRPWLQTAEHSNGLIFTSWNQVKGDKVGGVVGARTGRLSSTPNFQNMPNVFKAIFKHQAKDAKTRRALPSSPFKDLPQLPHVRGYIIPFKGEVFIDRDYSQQEPRILAHFEDGNLKARYDKDPWMDVHDDAQAELANAGLHYERKPVKNTNLGLIYGMGVALLAERNEMSVEESSKLKKAVLQLYPGLKEMYKDMQYRAKMNLPIRTWGGREYYCEPPKIVKGRIREFDYKMVNVLVQGSAADCTKEAVIRWHKAIKKHGKQGVWKLLLNVHDQLTSSVPKKDLQKAMAVKQDCMEGIEFSVPMLTEGAISDTNWADLKDYDKRGALL